MLTHWPQILCENGPKGDWTQFVVFLVMVIFWVIGGLLQKFRKNVDDVQEKPQQQRQPGQKRVHIKPAGKPAQIAHLKTARLPHEKHIRAKQPDTPEIAAPICGFDTKPAKTFSSQAASLKLPSYSDLLVIPETSPIEFDLHNTDELRHAIVYHEIFGKPVALRQSIEF